MTIPYYSTLLYIHYCSKGNPESRESGRLYSGVMTRLAAAGFTGIKKAPRAFGVTANAGVGIGADVGGSIGGVGQSDVAMTSSSGGGVRRGLGRSRVRTTGGGVGEVDGEGEGDVYDETS